MVFSRRFQTRLLMHSIDLVVRVRVFAFDRARDTRARTTGRIDDERDDDDDDAWLRAGLVRVERRRDG